MRDWYIGCAPAFHAGETGSSPVFRSRIGPKSLGYLLPYIGGQLPPPSVFRVAGYPSHNLLSSICIVGLAATIPACHAGDASSILARYTALSCHRCLRTEETPRTVGRLLRLRTSGEVTLDH